MSLSSEPPLSRAFLESVVATVHEPLLVLDASLRVVMASDAFLARFHVQRADTEQHLLHELGGGCWNIPGLRELLIGVLERGAVLGNHEVQHPFKDQGPRTVRLNARRLAPPSGSEQAMLLLAIEDVTGHEQERDAAQLASIVRSSRDGIISKNLDGIIQSWNRGAQLLFGYTAEEAIGQPISMLIPADHLDDEPRILERIRAGEAIEHYETTRMRKDGSLIDISLTVSPMLDASGRIVGASKVARDVSESRRSRDALRESEERLRESHVRLAEADRRKNEFLAMLAHEMRNPLAPIRNALEILRQANHHSETTLSAIAMMERQVAQMVHLVDDLIDVNRITRGKIELRRVAVDLATILRQAVEVAQPICDQKGVLLTLDFPAERVVLDADPLRLIQALGNLLHNACKFTDKGGNVWLDVRREGDQVELWVRDSGIGISADQLPRIFELFVQGDLSLERSSGGLGIGLSLARNLVELHGGTVRASSAGRGRGSEFVVRLPIAMALDSPDEDGPLVATIETPAIASHRILVVDDNRDAAESLAMLLELSGHETRLAFDGLEAVALSAQFLPEVVLLDIGLPKMNGYEVAARIRALPGGDATLLIALTGWGHDEERQRSAQAGFDGHLVKPVFPDALLKLIAERLDRP
ncbi:PAS domain-containing hybrid sensor histidine kinase/response regulator [Hydrogenophaga sp. BPS33]|uniref:PAS domain-containing hybrid sensor histidine kinase/response regulator n=1 Tax=Hydrogenophaga sp. BPS33 TaxID=2651974 RepID=UPI00135716B0|nr:ATP-binding protein [Hydrogenophaga sp. BPS33]